LNFFRSATAPAMPVVYISRALFPVWIWKSAWNKPRP